MIRHKLLFISLALPSHVLAAPPCSGTWAGILQQLDLQTIFANISAPNTLGWLGTGTAGGSFRGCYPTQTAFMTACITGQNYTASPNTLAFVSPTSLITITWGFPDVTLASVTGERITLEERMVGDIPGSGTTTITVPVPVAVVTTTMATTLTTTTSPSHALAPSSTPPFSKQITLTSPSSDIVPMSTPTSSADTSQASTDDRSSPAAVGAIAGSIAGSVVIIAILLTLWVRGWFPFRRRKMHSEERPIDRGGVWDGSGRMTVGWRRGTGHPFESPGGKIVYGNVGGGGR